MDSDEKQIKQVIKNINITYRDHTTANKRCYINATMTKRILTFYHWTIFAIKEGGAKYDVNTVAEFNRDWISSIMDAYTTEQPDATEQSTAFSVGVTKYNRTNWFDVRGQNYSSCLPELDILASHCHTFFAKRGWSGKILNTLPQSKTEGSPLRD